MASKRHIRKRSCTSKIRYDTKQNAHKGCTYLMKQKVKQMGTSYKSYHVYQCAFCGGYHVGHAALNRRLDGNYKKQ